MRKVENLNDESLLRQYAYNADSEYDERRASREPDHMALDEWQSLSDRELEALYLSACAENIRWLLDAYRIERDELVIEGWAVEHRGQPEQAGFLINGSSFNHVRYPISSPDVGDFFWNVPTAHAARFVCTTRIDWGHAFHDGFARLEFTPVDINPEQARRRAWYLPDPRSELPIPSGPQIQRVISVPDARNYLIGGAAVYKRLEHYLEHTFSKTFNDFPRILDFGCGCGRVARHFRWSNRSRVWGIDVDADNIAWCRQNLPHGQFLQTEILPPIPFPDDSFDLVLAISVLSQFSETHQLSWLRELKRVTRKDGLLAVALPGLSQMGLSRPHPSLLREIDRRGFVETGRSPDLDDVMPNQTHYISGLHSRAYIHSVWSTKFSIVDTIDAMAASHDLIVLKNDKTGMAFETKSEPAQENPFAVPLRDYDINPFIHPTIVKSGYRGHIVDMKGTDFVGAELGDVRRP